MILIADSGSTSTSWCLVDNNHKINEFTSDGINPFQQTQLDISEKLEIQVVPKLDTSKIEVIYFYGAGCSYTDKKEIVKKALQSSFKVAAIEVNSDLLAACRSLLQDKKGIACILGTGSNSCFYNGTEVEENVSPLGFILGDEGSGAVLGKLFLSALLKNQLPAELKQKFLMEYDISTAVILDKVYKQKFPNRFLAQFSVYLNKNIQEKSIYKIVYKSFEEFFIKNVMQYNYKELEINFVGSIAFYFKPVLLDVANDLNIQINKIEQLPMNGLLEYHLNHP